MPILAFIAVMAFPGCEKDDKETQLDGEKLLIGTWALSASGYDANEDGTISDDEIMEIPEGMMLELTFNANYTGFVNQTGGGEPEYHSEFTWALSGSKLNIGEMDSDDTLQMELYSLTDTELAFVDISEEDGMVTYFKKK